MLKQNGRHLTHGIVNACLNENVWISFQLSPIIVLKVPINNIPTVDKP